MVQLLQEMNGTFEYTSHHKQNTGMQIPDKHTDDPLMSVPHDLARQAAWKQRLEKQGELHLGLGKVAPKPGEDDESFVRRLFPVDKALHYGIKR